MATELSRKDGGKLLFINSAFDYLDLRCDCGQLFRARQYRGLGHKLSVADTFCDACEVARNRADTEAKEIAARLAAVEEQIPVRYRWATVNSPELRRRVVPEQAIARAVAAAGASSLVLLGPAGSGKTSLACAVLRAEASRRGIYAGTYTTAFALAKARQEHKLGDGEAPIIERACKARLLLLDELGAELGRNTAVQEVFCARHDAELPTIYTSGQSVEELIQRYGDMVARRLLQGATVIHLGGKR